MIYVRSDATAQENPKWNPDDPEALREKTEALCELERAYRAGRPVWLVVRTGTEFLPELQAQRTGGGFEYGLTTVPGRWEELGSLVRDAIMVLLEERKGSDDCERALAIVDGVVEAAIASNVDLQAICQRAKNRPSKLPKER